MTNPTTYAAALRLLERTDKGANAGHLARSLHLTFGEADALEAELLANGDARRLENGRLGPAVRAAAPTADTVAAVAPAIERTVTRAELGDSWALWVEQGTGTHAVLMDRESAPGRLVWIETDQSTAASYAATYGAERAAVIADPDAREANPAETLARATGATSVTHTVERRNLDGSLEVLEVHQSGGPCLCDVPHAPRRDCSGIPA